MPGRCLLQLRELPPQGNDLPALLALRSRELLAQGGDNLAFTPGLGATASTLCLGSLLKPPDASRGFPLTTPASRSAAPVVGSPAETTAPPRNATSRRRTHSMRGPAPQGRTRAAAESNNKEERLIYLEGGTPSTPRSRRHPMHSDLAWQPYGP